MKKLFHLTLTLSLLLSAVFAQSSKRVDPIAKDASGLAIKGYDPVAYFTLGKATAGKADFVYEHKGAKYRFVSASHRDLFAADPEKYQPAFGGYCAWAVGNAYTAPADPEAWKIVGGKLYLNYNKEVQVKWSADESNLIGKGNKNWPNLHRD